MTTQEPDWKLKAFVDPKSGERTIIRKCTKPAVSPGHPDYGYRAYLTFLFSPRDETGLPTSSDSDALETIELEELPKLEAEGLGIFVAVVLSSGVKDFLFYTRDPKAFLERAAVIRDGQDRFQVGCEINPDARWSQYRDLP